MTALAQFWDGVAEKYAAKPLDNPDAYQRKLVVTKGQLSARDTILDIGCGTGSLALELAPHVEYVHALDVSPEMIRIAEEKAERAGVDNVRFHVGTLDELRDLPPASFQCITAYNILHLVEDRAGTLRRLFELLEPGGSFVSSTPCMGSMRIPMTPVLAVMRLFGKAPAVVELFHQTELEREFQDAGFVELDEPDVGAPKRTAFLVARKPDEQL